MKDKQRILVLAPHTDDGELGCGATIARFIEEGGEVYYAAFSICEESVPEGFPRNILESEVKKATVKLGIKRENLIIKKYPVRNFFLHRQDILEDLILLKGELNPELVFLPSSFDVHQDHTTIFQEGRRAFKSESILGYEFMWNNFAFDTTCFYVVGQRHIDKKIEALDEYDSQKHRFQAKEKMIIGLANYRGLQIAEEYAEAFEVIRWIVR
jgi:LmbE family N-acetylglucosaminyl deacetylase